MKRLFFEDVYLIISVVQLTLRRWLYIFNYPHTTLCNEETFLQDFLENRKCPLKDLLEKYVLLVTTAVCTLFKSFTTL